MEQMSQGKVKKVRKKAAAGTIFSKEHYDMCVAHNIQALPEINLKKDKTRNESKHDINVSELRELIQSIFLDCTQLPRYFEVKNPQFIRDVVVVHFSNCKSLNDLGRESTLPVHCVRNFKYSSPVREYPHHLLTVSMLDDADGENVSDSAISGFERGTLGSYVLSKSSMRTWGYPVPPLSSNESANNADTNASQTRDFDGIDCHQYKRRKLSADGVESVTKESNPLSEEHEEIRGMLGGVLTIPSLSNAVESLRKIKEDPSSWYEVPSLSTFGYQKIETCGQSSTPSHVQMLKSDACVTNGRECVKDFDNSKSLNITTIAVDCEMCDTSFGPELTRVSLVDYNGVVILDTLVKPYNTVIDYKENFSGINSTMLDGVNVRIEQVQMAIMSLISPSTILVGHSLENDLYALKLSHYSCVDTAVLYPHPLGFPHRHSLKYLAKEHLKVNIQNSGSNKSGFGHSSVEDARVALQLAKLKSENGPLFGLKKDREYPREPLLSKFVSAVKSAFFFGHEKSLKSRRSCIGGGVRSVHGNSNEEAVKMAVEHLKNHAKRQNLLYDRNFVYVELDCGEYERKELNLKVSENSDKASPFSSSYSLVQMIRDCLALHSNRDTLMLVSSQSSSQEVIDLQNQKNACAQAKSASIWTREMEEQLETKKFLNSFSDVELCILPSMRDAD